MKPLTLAAASLVLAPLAAHAADVTFQVPVDVSGLPAEVSMARIQCALLPIDPLNAKGFGSFTPKNGAFKGTVTVEINITSGKLIEGAPKVTSYACALYDGFAKVGAQDIVVSFANGDYTSPYQVPVDSKAPAPTKATGSIKLAPKP